MFFLLESLILGKAGQNMAKGFQTFLSIIIPVEGDDRFRHGGFQAPKSILDLVFSSPSYSSQEKFLTSQLKHFQINQRLSKPVTLPTRLKITFYLSLKYLHIVMHCRSDGAYNGVDKDFF